MVVCYHRGYFSLLVVLKMLALAEIEKTIKGFAQLGLTLEAAHWLVKVYELEQENFSHFELTERAEPSFILMTTNGKIGSKQIIKLPENAFDFPLFLMLNLLAHEMLHVKQKSEKDKVEDKNEREFQAYSENLFHKEFPLIPELSTFHQKAFGNKALEYYNRMGEGSELQKKYALQMDQIRHLIEKL